ncbi:MAG: DUF4465 domain-containing protein [Bacteroidales bacterium]|nr:DUF4465 domain-containing protein [Bacteroidales bacterium]
MMKKLFYTLVSLLLYLSAATAQSYLTPSEGFKAVDILPDYSAFSAFDIHDSLMYANDGDTIRCLNMKNGQEINKYGKPAGYASWPSFVTMSPDGTEIWAGYTNSGNTDDRIYSINVVTGVWDLQAHLSGNFDLEFLNDSILVSGLNSSDWEDPTSIFLLDTTGADNHRKIIEMGGSSAGLATDSKGNVYYGTYFYFSPDPNAIYRWDSASVANIIKNEGDTLKLDDAVKLTDLPNGAYDCEVDAAGNLLFNANSFSSDKVLATWNGTSGDGYNFDTLAIATDGMDWLTMIKSYGNVLDYNEGNGVYVLSWARPVAKVQRSAPPTLASPINVISAFENDANEEINLNNHFTDPDDTVALSYEIISNSFDTVASASISNDTLLILDFLKAGQTNIWIKATSNGQSVTEKIIVGVQPKISGSYAVTDFEDLTLAEESYWNGSDGSGGFVSGLVKFGNNYSGGFWDGWTYSNTSDVTTSGYTNQYSAITGAGFDTIASEGKNYGVAYVSTDWVTTEAIPLPSTFSDGSAHHVKGFYLTNSTYASLSMEQGDWVAKKFGGVDGNDPDYLKLLVWGKNNGVETDTVEFYLANYRFIDNSKDYIVKTWQWIELSSLGEIDTLLFNLSSSDVGTWGINTPMYFNVDNIYILPDTAPVVINPIADITEKDNVNDIVIDVSNIFSDVDNDMVKVSVLSNSNPEFATATISGNELSIDFIAEGTTTLIIEGSSNNKSAYDTVLVTVVADHAPVVANPVANIGVAENAADSVISLANLFTDADDDDASIIKSVKSNSNSAIVSASISGNDLTLSFIANATGEAEIVIEGVSNGKSVTDTLTITITPVTRIENATIANVVLYPNPSNGIFRVKTESGDICSIKVFNKNGTLVFANEHYSSNNEVDISNQPSGQYFISVKIGNVNRIESIIKK